jgi:hypothetical protein
MLLLLAIMNVIEEQMHKRLHKLACQQQHPQSSHKKVGVGVATLNQIPGWRTCPHHATLPRHFTHASDSTKNTDDSLGAFTHPQSFGGQELLPHTF